MWRAPIAGQAEAAARRAETDRFRKKNDPERKRYQTAAWHRFRFHILNRNPICQKLIHGRQCREPAMVVHHLLSPRQRPDLFLEPHNVLALCANCHPGGEEGTPLWKPGVDYVASIIAPPICV